MRLLWLIHAALASPPLFCRPKRNADSRPCKQTSRHKYPGCLPIVGKTDLDKAEVIPFCRQRESGLLRLQTGEPARRFLPVWRLPERTALEERSPRCLKGAVGMRPPDPLPQAAFAPWGLPAKQSTGIRTIAARQPFRCV